MNHNSRMSLWVAVPVVFETMILAALLLTGLIAALTPAPAHARPVRSSSPVECTSQVKPAHRAQCQRDYSKGILTRTPRTVALAMTDGTTDRCLWRVADTTVAYCADGSRYVS